MAIYLLVMLCDGLDNIAVLVILLRKCWSHQKAKNSIEHMGRMPISSHANGHLNRSWSFTCNHRRDKNYNLCSTVHGCTRHCENLFKFLRAIAPGVNADLRDGEYLLRGLADDQYIAQILAVPVQS